MGNLRTTNGQLKTIIFINDLAGLPEYRSRVNARSRVDKCVGLIRSHSQGHELGNGVPAARGFLVLQGVDPMTCGDEDVEEKCEDGEFGSGTAGAIGPALGVYLHS